MTYDGDFSKANLHDILQDLASDATSSDTEDAGVLDALEELRTQNRPGVGIASFGSCHGRANRQIVGMLVSTVVRLCRSNGSCSSFSEWL